MSSLLRIPLRAPPRTLVFIRLYAFPAQAKIQFKPPKGEQGFLAYARNWSRDPKLARKGLVPQQGNLPSTFLVRRLGHAYELYPLVFLLGFWVCLFFSIAVYSFSKAEIFLDKSTRVAPEDWERIRDSYWKKPTLLGDFEGKSRQRLDLMEMLEDEMLEAAKKRGTRE